MCIRPMLRYCIEAEQVPLIAWSCGGVICFVACIQGTATSRSCTRSSMSESREGPKVYLRGAEADAHTIIGMTLRTRSQDA